MKNIKLLLLVLLGSIAVSPLQAAGQKRQAPDSDERTAKRLRTEEPEHKVADGWDGFVDADDQVLPDAHEGSSFNDTDEKRIVANRVAPAQQAADDQVEAGSLNPCTNCQYQNDATATECGVCAYKPGEVIEQQVVQNHPKDALVVASKNKRHKLASPDIADRGCQSQLEAFFLNGGRNNVFWVHGYEFLHIDDVYNLVKTNKTIHSAFFRTVLANHPQIRHVLLTGGDINQIDESGNSFLWNALLDKNLPLVHLLVKKRISSRNFNEVDPEVLKSTVNDNPAIKKFITACMQAYCARYNTIDENTVSENTADEELIKAQNCLAQGAYINNRLFSSFTLLTQAVFYGKVNLVEFFLTIPSIDVNAVDENGNDTALLKACADLTVSPIIIKLLLKHPAINIHIKNIDGKTALELVETRLYGTRKDEIKQLFEDYEATRQAHREFQTLENSAPTLPHPLFNIKGIILIVGEFLGAREPRVEVVQDQEDGK